MKGKERDCERRLIQASGNHLCVHLYLTIYSLLDLGDLLVVDDLLLDQVVNFPEHCKSGNPGI